MLLNEFLKEHKKIAGIASHRRPATERNGSSHGAAREAGRADPKGERTARDE